jgi:hypothetical protein
VHTDIMHKSSLNPVFEGMKFADLALLMKQKRVRIHCSYGSGGYCVELLDSNNTGVSAYSWDAMDALEKAFNRLEARRSLYDEDTNPDIKPPDTSYSITNEKKS